MNTNLENNGSTETKAKASNIETGHAVIVSNFQKLILFVKSFGPAYNPSKPNLEIPQLESLYTSALALINDVTQANTQYNQKVNERIREFQGLNKLSTRLINALQSTDATPETVNNAKVFNRKLQGQRATPKSSTPVDPSTPAPKTISTSQLSFAQQIQHLSGLRSVLQIEPSYAPNELELQVATIQAKENELLLKNNEVITAYANVSNIRIARNQLLYSDTINVCDVAKEVKSYVKAVFGAKSPAYSKISKLNFTKKKV